MPRPRPPHLHREMTRHGRVVWFVRVGKKSRTRIRADYGTDEFWTAYRAALSGKPIEQPGAGKATPKSLAWLIERYKDSAAWKQLSAATRRQRENILIHVIELSGAVPYSAINRASIASGIDKRSDRPAAARHFRQTMRGLFKWAVDGGFVASDPTENTDVPRPKNKGGFKMWPPEWCAAYEARWPLGTRQRVWYEVIHGTGLRRSDAVRIGRQNIKEVRISDGHGGQRLERRASIRALKNNVTAFFIVSDRLQEAIDAGPIGDLTWIVGAKGGPLTKESFGNEFRDACIAAGVPGRAHGIRKTRATIEAENGASGAKLDAMLGWAMGSRTSAIYIQNADRARLAFGPVEEPNVNEIARTLQFGAGVSQKKP